MEVTSVPASPPDQASRQDPLVDVSGNIVTDTTMPYERNTKPHEEGDKEFEGTLDASSLVTTDTEDRITHREGSEEEDGVDMNGNHAVTNGNDVNGKPSSAEEPEEQASPRQRRKRGKSPRKKKTSRSVSPRAKQGNSSSPRSSGNRGIVEMNSTTSTASSYVIPVRNKPHRQESEFYSSFVLSMGTTCPFLSVLQRSWTRRE